MHKKNKENYDYDNALKIDFYISYKILKNQSENNSTKWCAL